MITFVSGWRTLDRDKVLLKVRDQSRPAVFFLDDVSNFGELLPDAPIIDLYRNGLLDFKVGSESNTLVRVNYDTDHDLIMRAVTHTLLNGADAQMVVTFDALDTLYRLFPAMRAGNAILAANERLDAPVGDRVLFTRGGSFRWTDHILEGRTALLVNTDILDAGTVQDEAEEFD